MKWTGAEKDYRLPWSEKEQSRLAPRFLASASGSLGLPLVSWVKCRRSGLEDQEFWGGM